MGCKGFVQVEYKEKDFEQTKSSLTFLPSLPPSLPPSFPPFLPPTGCDDCVWIEYWEKLEDYKRAKAQVENTAAAAAAAAAAVVVDKEGGKEGEAEGAWEPAAAAVRQAIPPRVKGRDDDH